MGFFHCFFSAEIKKNVFLLILCELRLKCKKYEINQNEKCTFELLSTTAIYKRANYSVSSITKTALMSLLKSNQWETMDRRSMCKSQRFPEKVPLQKR